jgi:nucleoside-diphosphate-sugar epimerase
MTSRTRRTVLVTGGAGYLGSVLVGRLLGAGARVVVLDNGRRASLGLLAHAGHPLLEFRVGDVRDRDAVAAAVDGADAVVHLAALVGQSLCDEHPSEAESVNVGGTEVVVGALPSGASLVALSTASVYGFVPGGTCDEATMPRPGSGYAQTKLAAEEVVLAGDTGVVLRPVTLFGTSGSIRLDLLPHTMCYEALRTGTIRVYEGGMLRSFIHVEDVAMAIERILWSGAAARSAAAADRVINLYNPDLHLTKAALAEVIAEVLAADVRHLEGYVDVDRRNYRVTSRYEGMAVGEMRGLADAVPGIAQALRLVALMRRADRQRSTDIRTPEHQDGQ